MKHISKFKSFNNKNVTVIKEGLWSRIFGDASTKDAAEDSLKGQGYSHTGRDEENYIMFQGQKFYDGDIEYDEYNSTSEIPRIENNKLIIANPVWKS